MLPSVNAKKVTNHLRINVNEHYLPIDAQKRRKSCVNFQMIFSTKFDPLIKSIRDYSITIIVRRFEL